MPQSALLKISPRILAAFHRLDDLPRDRPPLPWGAEPPETPYQVRPLGIPGYFVTSEGEVLSLRSGRHRYGAALSVLTPQVNAKGYRRLRLCASDEPGSPEWVERRAYVHRLVAEAFLGPGKPGEQVRHLNGKREDNRLSNLAWGDRRAQVEDERLHRATAPPGVYRLRGRVAELAPCERLAA